MAQVAHSKLVVLLEHEVRLAAKTLDKAMKLMSIEEPNDEEKTLGNALLVDAINACSAAMHGAEDDNSVLVLTSADKLLAVAKGGE